MGAWGTLLKVSDSEGRWSLLAPGELLFLPLTDTDSGLARDRLSSQEMPPSPKARGVFYHTTRGGRWQSPPTAQFAITVRMMPGPPLVTSCQHLAPG